MAQKLLILFRTENYSDPAVAVASILFFIRQTRRKVFKPLGTGSIAMKFCLELQKSPMIRLTF